MNELTQKIVAVLLVGNEVRGRRRLRALLQNQGYDVLEASTGEEGVAKATRFQPNAILLDMSGSDRDGMSALVKLRGSTPVPILVLSECAEEKVMIDTLDNGASDYITKPYSVSEFSARLRAAQRSFSEVPNAQVFRCGALSVDFVNRAVRVGDRPVRLTPTEYSLLRLLADHAGQVLDYRHILRKIWRTKVGAESMRCLRVYFCSLRDKLRGDPGAAEFLVTEPRVGYRLALPD